MVSWEQRVMVGDAKFDTSQDVTDFPYDVYAQMLGLKGIRVSKAEEVESALDEAFSADRPVVINAYTDPSVPFLPPHISFQEMKSFSASIFKGDNNAWDMIKQASKEIFAGYFPEKNS